MPSSITSNSSIGLRFESLDEEHCINYFSNAESLFKRYQQTGDIHALDQAIDQYRLSESLASEVFCVVRLASALRSRYKYYGCREDIDEAIKYLQKALVLTSSHRKPSILNNLGNALHDRFSYLQTDIADLDAAADAFTESISLRFPTDEGRAYPLSNLANTLNTRFNLTCDMDTLNQAIRCLREALQFRPLGHPERKATLNVLGTTLRTRSGHIDYGSGDLDESIECHRESASLHGPKSPQRYSPLHNLANGLRTRFQKTSDKANLEESIRIDRDLVETYPRTHTESSKFIIGLATSLRLSFELSGDPNVLNDAIRWGQESVLLATKADFTASNNFANLLRTRYDLHGNVKDLKLAREHLEYALSNCLPKHTDHSLLLHTLGCVLSLQAHHASSESEELYLQSIAAHKAALQERPEGHQFREASLCDLAGVFRSFYEQTGKLEYLEESIALYHEVLHISDSSRSQHHITLLNVSNARMCRFDALRQDDDIQQALDFCREAVNKTTTTAKAALLGALSMVALRSYEARHDFMDLTTALSAGQEAYDLCEPGNPARSQITSNLAHAYIAQFRHIKEEPDCILVLNKAIQLLEECVDLRDVQNIRHSEIACLGHAFGERYRALHDHGDLHKAIELLNKAVQELPLNCPSLSSILRNLALSIYLRWELFQNEDDIVLSFSLFRQACSTSSSPSRVRLEAALTWITCARQTSHKDAIEGYRNALDLMARTLFISPTIEHQREALSQAPKMLALDAAAYAISHGEVETGVEMLEQGRSLLWSRMRGYRRPIEELREHDRTLADEFEQVSKQLDLLATSSDVQDSFGDSSQEKAEAQWKRQRQLSEKWENLLKQIRQIPGFEDLLQPIPYDRLRASACSGPVIAVILASHSLNAVIIREHDAAVAIPLSPDIRSWYNIANELRGKAFTRSFRKSADAPSRRPKTSSLSIELCLQQIWDKIVQPVVMVLGNLGFSKMARIWWCPTSVLCSLPFHAARPVAPAEHGIHDLYISSYTPSLASLITARARASLAPKLPPKLLAVACPGGNLRHVAEEVRAVHDTLRDVLQVCELIDSEAKADTVCGMLSKHTWFHIACHGKLNPSDPFQSSFKLYDGTLSIVDIMCAQVPSADLAFLSACDSAAGDDDYPDEAIHLAAALQFCGFCSVVGTLWPMVDSDGPLIARQFYTSVLQGCDHATALSRAVDGLRASVPKGQKERWLPFVHIGI